MRIFSLEKINSFFKTKNMRLWNSSRIKASYFFMKISNSGYLAPTHKKLFYRIKNHFEKLHSNTVAELKAWKEKDEYRWCCDLRSAKQQIEEWKQKQTRISSQSQHCYKELCRRIDLMLSDPTREILIQERYPKAPPSTKKTEGSKAAK